MGAKLWMHLLELGDQQLPLSHTEAQNFVFIMVINLPKLGEIQKDRWTFALSFKS